MILRTDVKYFLARKLLELTHSAKLTPGGAVTYEIPSHTEKYLPL
jgi:hypothetical protein